MPSALLVSGPAAESESGFLFTGGKNEENSCCGGFLLLFDSVSLESIFRDQD